MADPQTLHLDGLLDRIDRTLYHHEQLSQWDDPDPGGSIYPQQVERQRLAAASGWTVTWTPPVEDGRPFTVEVAEPLVIQTDNSAGTFTPTGPPHFPVPSLSSTLPAPLGDIVDWENGDVIVTLKRRPWWRRIWRRRG